MALTVAQMRALMLNTSRPEVFDLPESGQISASDINDALGRNPTAQFNIGGAEERALAEVPSGEIKFSDFYGKSLAVGNLIVGSISLQVDVYGFYDGSDPTFPAPFGDILPSATIPIDGTNYTITNISATFVTPDYPNNIQFVTAPPQATLTFEIETAPNSGVFSAFVLTRDPEGIYRINNQTLNTIIKDANANTTGLKFNLYP